MRFEFSDEQATLRTAVRDVLDARAGPQVYRDVMNSTEGFDPDLWQIITNLGWTATAIKTEDGGLGLGMVELAILFEEAGRALLSAPLMSTVGLAASVVAASDLGPARQEFLGRVARGEVRATLALTEQGHGWDAAGVRAEATETENGWMLSGLKSFVPDAHLADEIVVVARTARARYAESGITVFLIRRDDLPNPPNPQPSLDNTRRFSELLLDGLEVPADRIVGRLDEAWPAVARGLDSALVAIAAEGLGVSQTVLDLSVDYAKERIQFGLPIGSFQGVSHQVANQFAAIEIARSVVYRAACALDDRSEDASLWAAMAKMAVGEASRYATNVGIQVHGGIGVTWENDMHLFYRRAKWDELFLGDVASWRAKVGERLASPEIHLQDFSQSR